MDRGERDVELLFEIGSMRHIDRAWRQFGGEPFANVAEHTLRVVWISLIIASREMADVERVIKMALIHDLSEVRCGDRNYLTRQYAGSNEHQAVCDSLRGTSVKNELQSLWDEYNKRESIESKIVKDADNLDCDLELRERASAGSRLPEVLRETRERVKAKLYTKTAVDMFERINSLDPHSWHLRGNNRLNSGDWQY